MINKRFNIVLTKEQMRMLTSLSDNMGITKSEILRRSLETYYTQEEEQISSDKWRRILFKRSKQDKQFPNCRIIIMKDGLPGKVVVGINGKFGFTGKRISEIHRDLLTIYQDVPGVGKNECSVLWEHISYLEFLELEAKS